MGIRYVRLPGSVNQASDIMPSGPPRISTSILADCQRLAGRSTRRGPGAMAHVAFAPLHRLRLQRASTTARAAKLARSLKVPPAHPLRVKPFPRTKTPMERLGAGLSPTWPGTSWEGDDVRLAHGIHFNDRDVAHLGAHPTPGIAHCPCSNMRLGSGRAAGERSPPRPAAR
jgi:8-oxoguanine deaminase